MRRVLARAVSRVAPTLDATATASPSSSRASSSSSRASSPTGPDGASRAPRPRARVDARTLPRPPPRATDDEEADDAREEDDETDDPETIARANAEKRRAFHAARGMDVLEIGGPAGPLEPTRYGDWERGGRASDF